jgi:uncharacterized protein (TIGR03435 family)
MNRHRVVSTTAGAVFLLVILSAAQDVKEFEFVSVYRVPTPVAKAVGAPVPGGELLLLPNGRFEARRETLVKLAQVAYGFDSLDAKRGVVQASDWVLTDRFDVIAAADHPWTTPPSGTIVPDELRPMLRALLEDRFALKTRIETKNLDVTALRLAKPDTLGPAIRPTSAQCRGPFTDPPSGEEAPIPRCPYEYRGVELQVQSVTMLELVQLLSQNVALKTELLVDETGLPGRYDVSFLLPRHGNGMAPLQVIKEMEKQFGFEIKRTTMALPTLIIESAKKPKEN